jgi:hypothetical protein
MKTLPAIFAAALLLSSCGGRPAEYREGPEQFDEVRSRADLDNFAGKYVAVEGTFGHVAAQHGTVTLQSGLVIYVPHFDKFKNGDDWLKYVGRPVRVEGLLHTEANHVAGVSGPMINIRRFEPLEPSE